MVPPPSVVHPKALQSQFQLMRTLGVLFGVLALVGFYLWVNPWQRYKIRADGEPAVKAFLVDHYLRTELAARGAYTYDKARRAELERLIQVLRFDIEHIKTPGAPIAAQTTVLTPEGEREFLFRFHKRPRRIKWRVWGLDPDRHPDFETPKWRDQARCDDVAKRLKRGGPVSKLDKRYCGDL